MQRETLKVVFESNLQTKYSKQLFPQLVDFFWKINIKSEFLKFLQNTIKVVDPISSANVYESLQEKSYLEIKSSKCVFTDCLEAVIARVVLAFRNEAHTRALECAACVRSGRAFKICVSLLCTRVNSESSDIIILDFKNRF